MRVLFTGATGVIGEASIPILVGAGHEVRAVVRWPADQHRLRALGVQPVRADLFDRAAVDRVVDGVDAIVHMATSIPAQDEMTKRAAWVGNDRLRTEATGLLVDAALDRGVERFVQQSITLVYAEGGDRWLDEDAPVEPIWEVMDSALDGEAHLDRFRAAGGAGVTLRLASLYGPGRASSGFLDAVEHRKIPIVGDGQNFISRLHVVDAASAIDAALTAPAGTYNVADSRPVRVDEELHLLAELLDAWAPRRVPRWLARVAVGRASRLLVVSHRVSSRRFTEATGWQPTFASSRDGWADAVERSGRALEGAC